MPVLFYALGLMFMHSLHHTLTMFICSIAAICYLHVYTLTSYYMHLYLFVSLKQLYAMHITSNKYLG